MFWNLILGFLRDGQPRHGYELMSEYKARSGNKLSAGNFYRELARLTRDGLVETGINPPEADARRIPYRIKEKGRESFDRWLLSPWTEDSDLSVWLLFVDRVPLAVRDRILDRRQEELWVLSKKLARMRDDALAADRTRTSPIGYDPLPVLLSRQMKQVAAEIEFLKEFRSEIEGWQRARHQPDEGQIGGEARASRRDKGPGRKRWTRSSV